MSENPMHCARTDGAKAKPMGRFRRWRPHRDPRPAPHASEARSRPVSGLGWRQAAECLPVASGFAYRHKHAGNGGRQILSIHMKGDLVDLQNSLLGVADHNVQMLTAGEVAMIPVEAIRELAFARPNVGMAMWYETLVEGSIFREWVLNIGRRDARTRIAHLLCEFAIRLEGAELGAAHELRAADHPGAAGRRGRADLGPRQPNADEARTGRADHAHPADHLDHRLEGAGQGRRFRAALPPSRRRRTGAGAGSRVLEHLLRGCRHRRRITGARLTGQIEISLREFAVDRSRDVGRGNLCGSQFLLSALSEIFRVVARHTLHPEHAILRLTQKRVLNLV